MIFIYKFTTKRENRIHEKACIFIEYFTVFIHIFLHLRTNVVKILIY